MDQWAVKAVAEAAVPAAASVVPEAASAVPERVEVPEALEVR